MGFAAGSMRELIRRASERRYTSGQMTVAQHGRPALDLANSRNSDNVGKLLYGGRYELLDLVGAGGAGTVYRARDIELDEVVALKVLRKELVRSPAILERFRSEVKLARRVTHRNVARMFDMRAQSFWQRGWA